MEKQRVGLADIVVGKPLTWNVYDAEGKLLLSKGHLIEHERQIQGLIERGLFIEAQASSRPTAAHEKIKEPPSALRLINLANRRLEALLVNLPNETNARDKLLEVARAITHAASIDPDVALASILFNQDAGIYPVRHSINTAIVALIVLRALKTPPDETLMVTAAALTMNVAMLRLQEKLQQSVAPLTAEETALIRAHPEESVRQLQTAGIQDASWLACVAMHHENEDGSGYPAGKTGKDIPLHAKVLAIADRYCARISTTRSYRKPMLPTTALRDLLVTDKNNVDQSLATVFIRELGIYPTGTFARLENGEIGVVTHQGSTTTTPIVHVLIGPRGTPLAMPIQRDTAKQLHAIREVLDKEQAAIRFTMQQLWGVSAST